MRIVEPATGARINVPSDATWPRILVRTDAAGPHRWDWTATRHTFSRKRSSSTATNVFEAGEALRDLGGKVTITATADSGSSRQKAKIDITVVGSNPSAHEIDAYLATKADSAGFAAILRHETRYRHFRGTGEPIRSLDSGFSIAQLTSPHPTYEQCWNWKRTSTPGLTSSPRRYGPHGAI